MKKKAKKSQPKNGRRQSLKIIWTWGYFPFVVGGRVHRPVSCEVTVDGPYDLGKGFRGFTVSSPSGKRFVIDAKTGGIVGSSIEEVMSDVSKANKKTIDDQLKKEAKNAKSAQRLEPADFWQHVRGATT